MERPDPNRPSDAARSLMYDMEIGLDWKEFVERPAWVNMATQLYVMKDEMVRRLVLDEGDRQFARASVLVIDSMLTVPEAMMARGKQAEEDLRYAADERNL